MQYDKLTFGARFLTIAPALFTSVSKAPPILYSIMPMQNRRQAQESCAPPSCCPRHIHQIKHQMTKIITLHCK